MVLARWKVGRDEQAEQATTCSPVHSPFIDCARIVRAITPPPLTTQTEDSKISKDDLPRSSYGRPLRRTKDLELSDLYLPKNFKRSQNSKNRRKSKTVRRYPERLRRTMISEEPSGTIVVSQEGWQVEKAEEDAKCNRTPSHSRLGSPFHSTMVLAEGLRCKSGGG